MATTQIPELEQNRSAQPFRLPTSRFDGSSGPRIIGPRDGKFVDLQSVGVRFMIWGAETGGTFSLVEHPIPPAHPGRAASPARAGGRVQLRARGADGRTAGQGCGVRRAG